MPIGVGVSDVFHALAAPARRAILDELRDRDGRYKFHSIDTAPLREIAERWFGVPDVHAEHKRLRDQGVTFTQDPVEMGPVTVAVFDDTCGNLIQIASQ